jgi:DNA-binding NarL/FixJ family response regulator
VAPQPPITLLIAEDDALLRGFLNRVLTAEPDFKVLGMVGSGSEVLPEVERHHPRVLLLDVQLPGMSGLRVLQQLIDHPEPPATLVLSGSEDEDTQLEAARGGAKGFLCKSQAINSITQAVRKIAAGETWFSPLILSRIVSDYPRVVRRIREQDGPLNQLSEREREVLVRVARGHTNQQIATDLFMSVSTVKVHLRNIFSKLNLPNRTEAAVFAVREGLLKD